MRTILSILLIFNLAFAYAQEETPSTEEMQQGLGELQNQFKNLIDFYGKYDKKTSDKEKRAAYEKVVDDTEKREGEKIDQKDRNDAFQFIDAYIKADKAPSKPQKSKKQVVLKDNPEIKRQAQEQFDAALAQLMAMSYEEYEAHIWQIKPMVSRREIKESYNDLHKDDGRLVSITTADDLPTETQKQVKALQQMENAKTYKEYKEALLIINPSLTEKDIRRGWDNK